MTQIPDSPLERQTSCRSNKILAYPQKYFQVLYHNTFSKLKEQQQAVSQN